jgi:hypothetical protein
LQLLLALGHLFTEGPDVELDFARKPEDLALLFLDVVLYVFSKHLHLGVKQLVAWRFSLDLCNQILGTGMLDLRF